MEQLGRLEMIGNESNQRIGSKKTNFVNLAAGEISLHTKTRDDLAAVRFS